MYDGRKLVNWWLIWEEDQLWDDIARARKENPDLFKIHLSDEVLGKAILTSTVDDNSDFKSIWDKASETENKDETGLKRFFIPAQYKKDDTNEI